MLAGYAPSGVLVNEAMEVMQFRGRTSPYLAPRQVQASLNLFKMARQDLMEDLRSAVAEAIKTRSPVHRNGLEFNHQGRKRRVNLAVLPIQGASATELYFLVLFAEPPEPATPVQSGRSNDRQGESASDRSRANHLKRELAAAQKYLQSIIKEQETTNAELRSANEENESSNEELQSTNEELQAAKAELQSANEELTTVNEELQNRNSELDQLNNDLTNLLGGVNLPIVMLGTDLRIRRYTPMAGKVLHLSPADVGRPIGDVKRLRIVPDLEKLVLDVIETLIVTQREVQDREGRWFSLRIQPYKTDQQNIGGAVLALLDIDTLKRSADELEATRNFAQAIVETVREPLVVLDSDWRVKSANQAFYATFQVTAEETLGRPFYGLSNGQWNLPELRALLEGVLAWDNVFDDFMVECDFAEVGPKRMLLNARRLSGDGRRTEMILLAMQEIASSRAGAQSVSSAG